MTMTLNPATPDVRDAALSSPVIFTPLGTEAWAVRGARTPVRRTGMGPARSAAVAAHGPALVAGVGGGLAPQVRAGDVVVATAVRDEEGAAVRCPSAPLLAGSLRTLGLTVHLGPIVSARQVAGGAARERLTATGALAVDTESFWLAPQDGAPFAVVRVISDTADQPLAHPGILIRGPRALATLRRAVPALDAWAAAIAPREVIRYATTDRQREARAVAAGCDHLIVVGSPHSSDSLRLVEVARREGVPAHLVDDAAQVDLSWLADAGRIGITTDASAPPHLVAELVEALAGLGAISIAETVVTPEDVHFILPKEVA